jgi:hypothetical protein
LLAQEIVAAFSAWLDQQTLASSKVDLLSFPSANECLTCSLPLHLVMNRLAKPARLDVVPMQLDWNGI